jgi:hypothetical protein
MRNNEEDPDSSFTEHPRPAKQDNVVGSVDSRKIVLKLNGSFQRNATSAR